MDSRRTFFLGLILAVVTGALYWPATKFDFIVVDDGLYVTENPWTQKGLSLANLNWAFTSAHAANWHPITWISHMLDCAMFGLFAGGHHLTSILLHTLDTLLLFLLLQRLTSSSWPSFVVAALFGWHPLHVESVAWIAERKDVLSTLFLILTIWAYARFVSNPTKTNYTAALLFFALGLMSKPMLVTLPCVLLLLDYWPLRRFRFNDPSLAATSRKLFVEKVPFFALSLAASVITFAVQRKGGAVSSLEEVSFAMRLLNSIAAYGGYIAKTLLPIRLSPYYPLPTEPPIFPAIVSAFLLAGVSIAAFRWRNRFPWLLIGWLWFLGTLVPVIGLVQVGQQAMADRYTYIPSIGLFIAIVWSAQHWLLARPLYLQIGTGTTAAILVACAVLTAKQLSHWQDSISLFTHAIEVTRNNAFAHQNLGVALSQAGRSAEAVEQFEKALRIKPRHIPTHYNLGIELASLGQLDKAIAHFSEAARLGSRSEKLENNLGVVLARKGELSSAIQHFQTAIEINPDYPKPYLNYAAAEQKLGNAETALTNYTKALSLDADWPEALDKFAFFVATCPEVKLQDPAAAIKLAQRAVELTESKTPQHLETLALAYAKAGRFSNAVSTAELARDHAETKNSQALTYRLNESLPLYREGKVPLADWKNPP